MNFMRSSWDFCENVQPDLVDRCWKTAFNTASVNISFNGISFFDISRHYGSGSTFGAKIFDVLFNICAKSQMPFPALAVFHRFERWFWVCRRVYFEKAIFLFLFGVDPWQLRVISWSCPFVRSGLILCITCLFLRKENLPLCVPMATAW